MHTFTNIEFFVFKGSIKVLKSFKLKVGKENGKQESYKDVEHHVKRIRQENKILF